MDETKQEIKDNLLVTYERLNQARTELIGAQATRALAFIKLSEAGAPSKAVHALGEDMLNMEFMLRDMMTTVIDQVVFLEKRSD